MAHAVESMTHAAKATPSRRLQTRNGGSCSRAPPVPSPFSQLWHSSKAVLSSFVCPATGKYNKVCHNGSCGMPHENVRPQAGDPYTARESSIYTWGLVGALLQGVSRCVSLCGCTTLVPRAVWRSIDASTPSPCAHMQRDAGSRRHDRRPELVGGRQGQGVHVLLARRNVGDMLRLELHSCGAQILREAK